MKETFKVRTRVFTKKKPGQNIPGVISEARKQKRKLRREKQMSKATEVAETKMVKPPKKIVFPPGMVAPDIIMPVSKISRLSKKKRHKLRVAKIKAFQKEAEQRKKKPILPPKIKTVVLPPKL